jgi:GNAT superfamily N-acetyltransferase
VIRPAEAADVGAVAATVGGSIEGLPDDRTLALVGESIARGGCLVDEDVDGAIRGIVLLESRTFFGYDFVKLLVVGPSSRRRGIALQLLEAACASVATDKVFISTNESNAAMRALLAGQGWTYSGTLHGIDDGDPELVFWRQLPPRADA